MSQKLGKPTEQPGAGESASRIDGGRACAYARATATLPTSFPINHNQPLGFTPVPPCRRCPSPIDDLPA